MRIDLYLKKSRLIKRRKVANEATSNELILINNKEAKPSTKVKIDDVITLNLGLKVIVVKVISLQMNKDELMYTLISEKFKGQE